MNSKKNTNRLINESSPYLLQHAHNPVDWYPWSDEALQKAKIEDKPILVSIGYSSCHWCHVMEKESFEDEGTAEMMNNYFVNIKIDREERPDLDHIYMDAVQSMTGSGGWPLNVFLTPDAKPFYGGTYFPPVRAFNRGSWKETLHAVHEAFVKRRNEVEAQAENLTTHMFNANLIGISISGEDQKDDFFSKENLQTIADHIMQSADTLWGGFGRAPKFPQTFVIQYLLRHYYFTSQESSLKQALLSLDKMIQGGIYDHLGGGFARYSTDEKWLAPHFEKMLYDNALLVSALSEAYQLTANELYARIIKETIDFVKEELLSPEGGFYSALDADSEGIEGKYYVWSKAEIENILGSDATVFCEVYNVTEQGNWEHSNILWLPRSIKNCSEKLQIEEQQLMKMLNAARKKLLDNRRKRIRPLLDDKILLGWNALMTTACCKAYAATSVDSYLQMAKNNVDFIESSLCDASGNWSHTWKEGKAKYPSFLDDYAYLVQAYIHLQEVTGNTQYLLKAKKITEIIMDNFHDNESAFFWFTNVSQKDLILRKKEIYDGAVPSGNSIMAQNLVYLSIVFDKSDWKFLAAKMLKSLGEVILRYPSSFGVWAMVMQQMTEGMNEIAITGSGALELLKKINNLFIPGRVIQSTILKNDEFPLLKGKFDGGQENKIYLCRNYSCKRPVKDIKDFILLLKN